MVGRDLVLHLHILRRGQITAVKGSGGNGLGIHQGYGSDLSRCRIGALPVGEVAGAVADAEIVVSGSIGSAEAGAAEGGLYPNAVVHQVVEHPDAVQLVHNGLGCRVNIQGERAKPPVLLFGNGVHRAYILKGTGGAARNGGLVYLNFAVYDLRL